MFDDLYLYLVKKHKFTQKLVTALLLAVLSIFPGKAFSQNPYDTLHKKPERIVIVSDDNYPPFIFRDEDGKLTGFLIDEWNLWQKKTGTRVEWLATDWNKALEIMRSGGADVIETVFYTRERAQWLSFSKPYVTIPVPVYFHRNLSGISDISTLKGFTIGAKSGDTSVEILRRNGITTIIEYPSYEAIINDVVAGNLKVFTIDEPPALYYIYKKNIDRELRQANVLYTGAFHRAVLKGNENILEYIENGFNLISSTERKELYDKWMGKPLVRPEYYRYTLLALLIFLGISGTLLLFTYFLRREVRRKTEQLNKAMDDLRKAEARWKFAIESTEQGLWDWNVQTGEVFFSKQWKNMLGYEEDEITNSLSEWEKRAHPDDLKQVWEEIEKHFRGETDIYTNEHRLLCKDGTYKWVLDRGKVIEFTGDGKPLRMIGTHTDISRKKEEEKILLEKEALYRFLFEHNPAPMLIYEKSTLNILAVNEALCSNYGYTLAELQNMKLHELVVESEQEILIERAAKVKGYSFSGEWHHKKKDGTMSTVLTHSHELIFEGKEARVIAITDITYLKEIEQELIEARNRAEESDRLKTAFLANMSHEIRTPMNAILGFMELLKRSDLLQEDRENFISIIEESGKRLLSTINDIIEISKIETGLVEVNLKPENLYEIISSALNLFKPIAQAKGLEFRIKCPEKTEICNILTDRFKIESIIINLLSNAVKFTKKGYIETGARLENNNIILYVKDTGPGIPPDKLEVVFNPFYQADMNLSREHEGSGLGLAIAKAYSEMLKGKLWVESEPGKGSTFFLSIPLIKSESEYHISENMENSVKEFIKPSKILVADDDETSFLLIKIMLAPYGIKCLHAANGKETLRILESENDISLILLDIKMPLMDGFETVKKLRERKISIPVIAVTAYAFPSDREKALAGGCNDYISKPVMKQELISKIKQYLS
ncbi:MAG: transporter substrate-binding domain-containing protein [Bacteroidales bacterium]